VFSTKLDFQLDTPEEVFAEELFLFPNPSSNFFNLSFVREGIIEVVAGNGQTVLSKSWETQTDISNLNSGFYLVRVRSNDGNFQQIFKLIKQ
jgi:hypothetical protein